MTKDVLKTRSVLRWPKVDSNLKTRRLEVLLSRGVPLFNKEDLAPQSGHVSNSWLRYLLSTFSRAHMPHSPESS